MGARQLSRVCKRGSWAAKPHLPAEEARAEDPAGLSPGASEQPQFPVRGGADPAGAPRAGGRLGDPEAAAGPSVTFLGLRPPASVRGPHSACRLIHPPLSTPASTRLQRTRQGWGWLGDPPTGEGWGPAVGGAGTPGTLGPLLPQAPCRRGRGRLCGGQAWRQLWKAQPFPGEVMGNAAAAEPPAQGPPSPLRS